MITPEELKLEADFKMNAAMKLLEEAVRLCEADSASHNCNSELPDQVEMKQEEARRLRNEVEELDERADLLREEFEGK